MSIFHLFAKSRSAAMAERSRGLIAVDRLAAALRVPRELREASLQTGRRRLAILIRLRPTPELELLDQISREDPLAWSSCHCLGRFLRAVPLEARWRLTTITRFVPVHGCSQIDSYWPGRHPTRSRRLPGETDRRVAQALDYLRAKRSAGSTRCSTSPRCATKSPMSVCLFPEYRRKNFILGRVVLWQLKS